MVLPYPVDYYSLFHGNRLTAPLQDQSISHWLYFPELYQMDDG